MTSICKVNRFLEYKVMYDDWEEVPPTLQSTMYRKVLERYSGYTEEESAGVRFYTDEILPRIIVVFLYHNTYIVFDNLKDYIDTCRVLEEDRYK